MITTHHLESYLDSFSEFEKLAPGHELPWLRRLRQDGFERFAAIGFPTTHDEDWRFTNISAIAQKSFELERNGLSRVSRKDLEPYRIAGVGCQLVFVNGHFTSALSSRGTCPIR